MSVNPIRVTVWNEYLQERTQADVAAIYPDGIHEALAAPLREQGFTVRTATQDQQEHGLTDAVLAQTDVLLWWGHRLHHQVDDAVVDRVQARVLAGMGLIPLHSSHFSKIFNRLMGTSCNLKHRVAGERERIWTIARGHPIAEGVPEHFDLKPEEMYGEPFDIPAPDELVFVSWFQGGEVFRSGCCYTRGLGRVFYFRPGHETYPTFHDVNVQRVIANAVWWAAPRDVAPMRFGRSSPLEVLE